MQLISFCLGLKGNCAPFYNYHIDSSVRHADCNLQTCRTDYNNIVLLANSWLTFLSWINLLAGLLTWLALDGGLG